MGIKGSRNKGEEIKARSSSPTFLTTGTICLTHGPLRLILLSLSTGPFLSTLGIRLFFCFLLSPERPHRPPRPESKIRHYLCLFFSFSPWSALTTSLCRVFLLSRPLQFNPLSLPSCHLGQIASPAEIDSRLQSVPFLLVPTQKPKCGLSKACS